MKKELHWLANAFSLAALLATGCGAEPAQPSFEDVVTAHAAPDLEVPGTWSTMGPSSDTLFISGSLEVGSTENLELSTGVRLGAVLTLQPPVHGIRRLYSCRFGTSEVLLPDQGCWFEPGDPPIPRGAVYMRVKLLPRLLDGYLPGPDDENTPAPWRDAYGEGR